MESEIKARLKLLKEEYQKGQERLLILNQETANLGNTMLRISGAIQVLEELIGGPSSGKSKDVNNDFELKENTQ